MSILMYIKTEAKLQKAQTQSLGDNLLLEVLVPTDPQSNQECCSACSVQKPALFF